MGKEFKLVKSRMGSAEGELWWFNDPVFVARLAATPLSERVEETVYRCLNERGRVTFTQVWDAVSQQFPNSLTSDSTSIKEALEIYGRPAGKGFWMLREEIRQHVRQHAEIIALAGADRTRGYDICIGRNEQGTRPAAWRRTNALSTLVTCRPEKLRDVSNLRTVLDMDLLWIKGDQVVTAFEVESTTTMTSGLLRGSNLPAATETRSWFCPRSAMPISGARCSRRCSRSISGGIVESRYTSEPCDRLSARRRMTWISRSLGSQGIQGQKAIASEKRNQACLNL